jgi:ketosteroid isomerase-like protein
MTLSLQEISDRFEIQDLLVAYSYAIDTRDWDALDDVFAPDAVIDYTEMGGTRGTLEETKAFLRKVMGMFAGFQHMVGTTQLTFDGDTAFGRTICHNPMVVDRGDGATDVMFCGLWYRDTFVRTPDGWRIKDRYEEKSYLHNLPAAGSASG